MYQNASEKFVLGNNPPLDTSAKANMTVWSSMILPLEIFGCSMLY